LFDRTTEKAADMNALIARAVATQVKEEWCERIRERSKKS
jgi:lambda repressor-like predicted transcriptional regulator